MTRLVLASVIFSLASPCASAKKLEPVRMIDAEAAKECVFKGSYSSTRIGMSSDKLISAATRDAGSKAAKDGANAGVLKSVTPQGSFMLVMLDGYVCKQSPESST